MDVIFLAPLSPSQVSTFSSVEKVAGIPLVEEDGAEQWVNLGVSPVLTQDIRWVLCPRDVVEAYHS